MDWVFRETEGNRQLIGHIANQVFTNDKNKPSWQTPEDFTDNNQKARYLNNLLKNQLIYTVTCKLNSVRYIMGNFM